MNRQLLEANQELQRLAARNNELRDMLKNAQTAAVAIGLSPKMSSSAAEEDEAVTPGPAPSLGVEAGPPDGYEVYRRRLQRDVRELWRYLNSQLEELAKNSQQANRTLADARHRYHVIMSDIGKRERDHIQWSQFNLDNISSSHQNHTAHDHLEFLVCLKNVCVRTVVNRRMFI